MRDFAALGNDGSGSFKAKGELISMGDAESFGVVVFEEAEDVEDVAEVEASGGDLNFYVVGGG